MLLNNYALLSSVVSLLLLSNEMRLVHQLMDTITDDGDMERMVVLDPLSKGPTGRRP